MDRFPADPAVTDFFNTYEARESAFNNAVGRLVPVRYQGPRVFWHDFQQIVQSEGRRRRNLPAFITSNPVDSLAFGTPAQVLAAAGIAETVNHRPGRTDQAELIDTFGLHTVLDQPIRTLSGGETVRLALAKTMAMADKSEQLVISSPFCWMSATHLPLLSQVVGHYTRQGKAVHILAMAGETSREPMARSLLDRLAITPLRFGLVCKDLKIQLDTPLNPVTARVRPAVVGDVVLSLKSPCLLVGDNGQGKSLLAKALCGAVGIEGTAVVSGRDEAGRPGLLFQDVVTQTLMRTIPVLADSAAGPGRVSPLTTFHGILDRYRSWSTQVGTDTAVDVDHNSLLAVKAVLLAVRLARWPSALILDEPDWGLSRCAAIALVLALVEKAHELGVPVIIISHKPWWRPLAADVVQVTKEGSGEGAGGFFIRLRSSVSAS